MAPVAIIRLVLSWSSLRYCTIDLYPSSWSTILASHRNRQHTATMAQYKLLVLSKPSKYPGRKLKIPGKAVVAVAVKQQLMLPLSKCH